MPPLLIALISSLVPVAVQTAEKIFGPDKGKEKHDWVTGFIETAIKAFEKIPGLPQWVKPAEDLMRVALNTAIETALKALDI